MRSLIALTAERDGTPSRVPLCHLWRLYESWIAVRTLSALESELGSGVELDDHGQSWAWRRQDLEVRLYTQATVGRAPFRAGTDVPGIVSVSSALRPDALVVVTDGDRRQVVVCVDAKQRTAATAMEPVAVASAASKYNWGLRQADDVERFATVMTVIASSAPVPSMNDSTSLIEAVHVAPGGGDEAFRDVVLRATAAAAAALDAA